MWNPNNPPSSFSRSVSVKESLTDSAAWGWLCKCAMTLPGVVKGPGVFPAASDILCNLGMTREVRRREGRERRERMRESHADVLLSLCLFLSLHLSVLLRPATNMEKKGFLKQISSIQCSWHHCGERGRLLSPPPPLPPPPRPERLPWNKLERSLTPTGRNTVGPGRIGILPEPVHNNTAYEGYMGDGGGLGYQWEMTDDVCVCARSPWGD